MAMIATTISTSTSVTPACPRRARAVDSSRGSGAASLDSARWSRALGVSPLADPATGRQWVMLDASFLDLFDAVQATGNAIGSGTHQYVGLPGLGPRANQGQWL